MSSGVAAVYRAVYSKPVSRPLIGWRVSAGFPSPAEDYIEGSLDLSKYLVKRTVATFYIRVRGDSMVGANIHPGNLLVVDRAEETRDGHIVVARIGDELCIKRLHIVEGPPPVPPPPELDFLHFNDKFIYLMAGVEVEARRKQSLKP